MAAGRSAFAVYQQKLQQQQQQQQQEAEELPKLSAAVGAGRSEASSRKGRRKRKSLDKNSTRKKKRRVEEATEAEGETVKSRVKCTKSAKWRKPLTSKPVKTARKQPVSRVQQPPLQTASPSGDSSAEGFDLEAVDYDGAAVAAGSAAAGLPPFSEQFRSVSYADSREAAHDLFSLLIYPQPPELFYKENWEQKPLLIRRGLLHYNAGWFSTVELDGILRQNPLEFTTNIDVTTYLDGVRETHNPVGRAFASAVWEFFQSGCSVRLLNPQTYSTSMWLLNSTLQEHFDSCVGANVYLTPAGSQGFAPHYDDIEAFVLQLEGRKEWKLYSPVSETGYLPRTSSGNFTEEEIGEPFMCVTLEPGDLLYFPRGTIHQAATLPGSHSLHITLSTYQMNSWGNFLEKLLPVALQNAIAEDVEFRQGLPQQYMDYMGVIHSESVDKRRTSFANKVSGFMSKLLTFAPIDAAADQMALQCVHSSLPPCLTAGEEELLWEHGSKWVGGEKAVEDGTRMTGDTRVKLLRQRAMRLVLEGDSPVLYYTTQNSRIYHEKDLQGMSIHYEDTLAVEHLLNSYPNYVSIESLPMEQGGTDEKIDLCYNLFVQGLLTLES